MAIVYDRAKQLVDELLERIGVGSSGSGEAWLDYDRGKLESLVAGAMAGLLEGLGDATLEDWKKLQAELEEARWEVKRLRAVVEGFTDMTVDVGLDTLVEVTKAKAELDGVVPAKLWALFEPTREKKQGRESMKEHRERLRPLLDLLKGHGRSEILDLCELMLMVAETTDGSLEWDHPRVLVKIRQKKAAERLLVKRTKEKR